MKLKTEQRSEPKWEKAPDKVSTLGTASKTETETGKISSNQTVVKELKDKHGQTRRPKLI
jgi:hypothetical protein